MVVTAERPGIGDATQRLAEAFTAPQPAWPGRDRLHICDRCDGPLQGSAYELQRHDPNASETSWTICHLCADDFAEWFDWPQVQKALGGTE